MKKFSKAHEPTNFPKWQIADAPYKVHANTFDKKINNQIASLLNMHSLRLFI